MDEMIIKSPSQTLNLINIIYDDEFVSMINSLSASIKEFYKSSKKSVSDLNSTLTSFSNETLVSKCLLGEIKANNSFDKIPQLSDRLNNIKDTQTSFDKTINSIDRDLIKFFEDAKVVFKKMKNARSKKIEDLIAKGHQFNIAAVRNKKYMSSRTSSAVKVQSSDSSQKQIKSTRENKLKIKNDGASRSVSPNYKLVSINKNTETNLSSSKLALNVISFLEEMIRLQESIMKHSGNVAEKKNKFELQKSELKKLAEKTLNLTNAYLSAKTNSYSSLKNWQHSNTKSKENLYQLNQCQSSDNYFNTNNDQVIGSLKNDIKQLEEENKKMNYEYLTKINLYENTILSLKEEIKSLSTELKKKTNQYLSTKALESELNKIKSQITSEQEEQNDNNTQITNQYDTIKLNNEIELLRNQIKKSDVEKQSLSISIDGFKKEIEQLSIDIVNYKNTIKQLGVQSRTLMNEVNKKNEEKNRIQIDNDQLKEENDELLQEKNGLRNHYEGVIRKMNKTIDQLTIKITKEADEKKKAIADHKNEIANLGREIDKLKLLTTVIEEDKKKLLKNEMDITHKMKNNLNKKDNTIEQMNQIIKENIMTINKLKQKIDSVEKDENVFPMTKLYISKQEQMIFKLNEKQQLVRNRSSMDKDKEIESTNSTISHFKNTNEDILTNLSIKAKLIDELEMKVDKITKDKVLLEKELDAMTQTYNKQLNSIQTIQEENSQLKEEMQLNKKHLDELALINSKNDKSNNSIIEELKSKLISEQKQLENQIAEGYIREVKELQNQLKIIQQSKIDVQIQLEAKISDLTNSIIIKEKEITELNNKIAFDSIELKNKSNTMGNLTTELSKLKQMSNQSEKEKETQLKNEIELNHQLTNSLQFKESELSKQIDFLNTELNKTKSLTDTISSLRLSLNDTENQLSNEKLKSKDLMTKITEYESLIESNAKKISELKHQIEFLQSDNDNTIELLAKEKKALCDDIVKLEETVTQLQIDNDTMISQLKTQSFALVNEKEKLNDSMNQLAKEKEKSKEIKLQEEQLDIYIKKYNDIERINKQLQMDIDNLINDKREVVNQMNNLKEEVDRISLQKKEIEEEKKTELIIFQEEYRKVLKENEILKNDKQNNKSENDPISPQTHTIIFDKKYNSMTWVLMQRNDNHEYKWVLLDKINNINEYNKYKTEDEERMEFSENMQISMKKLEQKEDIISKLSFEVNKLKDQALMNSSNVSNSKQKSKLSDKALFGMNNNNNSNFINSQHNQTIGSSNNNNNNNEDSVPLEKFNAVLKELNDANKRMTLIQTESIKLRKIIIEKDQNSSKLNGDISNNDNNNILGNINTDNNKTHRDRDENDTVEQLENQLKYFKNLYKELNNSNTVLSQNIKMLLSQIQVSTKNKGIVESICKIIKLNEDETSKIKIEDVKKKGILGNFFKKKD